MTEPMLRLDDVNLARVVFGEHDRHVTLLEQLLEIEIPLRGTEVSFKGGAEACKLARRILWEFYGLAGRDYPISDTDIQQAVQILTRDPGQLLSNIFLDTVAVSSHHKSITPKTLTQKTYVEAIRKNDVVFGWGPAGTGKTYLAMAMAVTTLLAKRVDRIILVRPAVEAGEKLGFLPGDLAEKVNPYLRPLYDALHDMIDFEKAQHLIENGTIEVAPLAFMRGRTLNGAFVILDEAQNATPEQMKMFLTRLGYGSKAVITGDVTQIDLPHGKPSGLMHAMDLLSRIDGIQMIEFTHVDVVRHPLVQKIIRAYEAEDENQETRE